MNNIELFDNYISGQLPQREREDFEARLASDSAFFSEFQLHLQAIHGIQKEEEEDCIEFGCAMKVLSKEELNAIIGNKTAKKVKFINFQKYLWPLSAAAVVIFALIFDHNQSIESQYAIDDIVYAYNEPMLSNRGGEAIDISKCNKEELEDMLPTLWDIYEDSETTQDALVNGKGLAMVYIKLHNREKAREILQELVDKYKADEDYAESVAECIRILNQISK
jgi:hypothetical protein